MRDTVCHIIRQSRQHAHRERTGFLPSSAPRERGGRVGIVISDAAVGHTLVDIVVSDLPRLDLVERAAKQDLVAATYAEHTIGIVESVRNLCPLLLRRTVHCQICRIIFWSNVQR